MSETLKLGDARVEPAALAELCERYRVKELALFGSAARGEMTAASDLDLMVEFKPGARIEIVAFETLSGELENLMGRKVDLVTKRGLKPWIRPHALRDARIIYAG